MIDAYLQRWGLVPDGDAVVTPSSRLVPVRRGADRAMLKIALGAEEEAGAALMVWWGGSGAARVLEHDGPALLLERAHDLDRLTRMAVGGRDDEASRVICAVAAVLHAKEPDRAPRLVPLERWFRELLPAARKHGGVLLDAARVADELLATPHDVVVLHGDLHHANVLDFGARGWLAIDPKGLLGERGFDLANVFCNPTVAWGNRPGRLAHQSHVVAEAGVLDRHRLLRWILAYAGLSAAWLLSSGNPPNGVLAIAELARSELRKA